MSSTNDCIAHSLKISAFLFHNDQSVTDQRFIVSQISKILMV